MLSAVSLDKQYEEVVAAIYLEFSPSASVTRDERIPGRTGEMRQIDVAIRTRVCGSEVFIVIECKRYKRRVASRRVDVSAVDELIGKIDDVAAHKGVLVSDSGFSKGALARARGDNRIQLTSVLDASNGLLRSRLHVPMTVTFSVLVEPYSATVRVDAQKLNLTRSDIELAIAQVRERGLDAVRSFHGWTATKEVAALPTGAHSWRQVLCESPVLVAIDFTFTKRLRAFVNDKVFTNVAGVYDHLLRKLVLGQAPGFTLEEQLVARTWREVDPDQVNASKVRKGAAAPHYQLLSWYTLSKAEDLFDELMQTWGAHLEKAKLDAPP